MLEWWAAGAAIQAIVGVIWTVVSLFEYHDNRRWARLGSPAKLRKDRRAVLIGVGLVLTAPAWPLTVAYVGGRGLGFLWGLGAAEWRESRDGPQDRQ